MGHFSFSSEATINPKSINNIKISHRSSDFQFTFVLLLPGSCVCMCVCGCVHACLCVCVCMPVRFCCKHLSGVLEGGCGLQKVLHVVPQLFLHLCTMGPLLRSCFSEGEGIRECGGQGVGEQNCRTCFVEPSPKPWDLQHWRMTEDVSFIATPSAREPLKQYYSWQHV